MDRAEIKEVKLVKKKDMYYLDLTYECEDNKSVYALNIPRVALPYFNNPRIEVLNVNDLMDVEISFAGGTTLPIKKDNNGTLFSKVIIEEKTHKMTVAEIEKKLGYKIEIVSDK